MKKISTLLTLGLLTAASASAVITPQVAGEGMAFSFTPEGAQMHRTAFAQLSSDIENNVVSPGTMKKMYVDRNGNVYDARFSMSALTLPEQLQFTNPETGETITYTFEQMPFYTVTYVLYQYDNQGNTVGIYNQVLEWPSMYLFDQIFSYTGELENGNVPESKRDYSAVPFETMANPFTLGTGMDQGRTFTENMGVGFELNDQENATQTWFMLPTEQLGIQSIYQNTPCFTSMNGVASNVTFHNYDEAEFAASFNSVIYLNVNGVNRAVRTDYEGGVMVMGFTPTTREWKTGTIHVFNLGELGSDVLGDMNYYPEDWGPLQGYRIFVPGEYMEVVVNTPNVPISDENIGFKWKDGIADADASFENINYSYSTIYSPVGAEPGSSVWHLILGEPAYDDFLGVDYLSIKPEPYTFVQNGWTYDWSQIDGCLVRYNNFPFAPQEGSKIFIGSTMGAGVMLNDGDNTTFLGTTTEDVVYHYNTNNISDTKTIPAVGDIEIEGGDGVKEILAEGNFNVAARNGAINVMAGENARVAIYSINGQLVKSVDAKAGQTVSVELAKGLYIVKAGKKAVKVVL